MLKRGERARKMGEGGWEGEEAEKAVADSRNSDVNAKRDKDEKRICEA